MPRKSLVERFFSAVIGIIQGIREIIIAFLFGKEALEVQTPKDESKIMEEPSPNTGKTTINKALKTKVKNLEKRAKGKEYKREKSEGNLDEFDASTYTPRKGDLVGVPESGDQPVGSNSIPAAQMTLSEFATALRQEFLEEYRQNPAGGAIEIGGREFVYAEEEQIKSKNESKRTILLKDKLSKTEMFSLEITDTLDNDGNQLRNEQLSDIKITDMTIFTRMEKAQEELDQHALIAEALKGETLAVQESEIGGETVVSANEICDEMKGARESAEVIYWEDEVREEQQLDNNENNKETTVQPEELLAPKDYRDFMQTVKDVFGADKITIAHSYIECHRPSDDIHPEAADAGMEEYRIKATGWIDARNETSWQKAHLTFMSAEEQVKFKEYICAHMSDIQQTLEYKLHAQLQDTNAPKNGKIENLRYENSGKRCELFNDATGQKIGYVQKGEIKFNIEASTLQEALVQTSQEFENNMQPPSIADACNIAKQGKIDELAAIISRYSPEQCEELAIELDFIQFTGNRIEKENAEQAMEYLTKAQSFDEPEQTK